jgi:hypothetical protein
MSEDRQVPRTTTDSGIPVASDEHSLGADTVRNPRGFALKFYTEEGNYDLGRRRPLAAAVADLP